MSRRPRFETQTLPPTQAAHAFVPGALCNVRDGFGSTGVIDFRQGAFSSGHPDPFNTNMEAVGHQPRAQFYPVNTGCVNTGYVSAGHMNAHPNGPTHAGPYETQGNDDAFGSQFTRNVAQSAGPQDNVATTPYLHYAQQHTPYPTGLVHAAQATPSPMHTAAPSQVHPSLQLLMQSGMHSSLHPSFQSALTGGMPLNNPQHLSAHQPVIYDPSTMKHLNPADFAATPGTQVFHELAAAQATAALSQPTPVQTAVQPPAQSKPTSILRRREPIRYEVSGATRRGLPRPVAATPSADKARSASNNESSSDRELSAAIRRCVDRRHDRR